MLKRILPIIIFCVCCFTTKAQVIDFDTLIAPLEQPEILFEEYLVQLAWVNNPENRKSDNLKAIAENNIKLAKWEWVDNIFATFNLNQGNIRGNFIYDNLGQIILDPDTGDPVRNPQVFYPVWNLTASIPLGTFITRPKRVDNERERLRMVQLDEDQKKLRVRAEVLSEWVKYSQMADVLLARVAAEEDAEEIYTLMSNLFRSGEEDFESYNIAAQGYHNAREKTILVQNEKRIYKLRLEELIGISLEKAKAYHERRYPTRRNSVKDRLKKKKRN